MILAAGLASALAGQVESLSPTPDPAGRKMLSATLASLGPHHTRHRELFGKGLTGFNLTVLSAVDRVQASQPKGGGYFADRDARPLESPVGYPLTLWGRTLFSPSRTTSFCSGATYAALVETLNFLSPVDPGADEAAFESLAQQESNGGRREDQVGFWGVWNGRSAGIWNALGPMTGAGRRVSPDQLQPGDFCHVFWKNSRGHSVVFLGWVEGRKMRVWSSQKATNGLGDYTFPLSRVKGLVGIRLISPLNVLLARPGYFVHEDTEGDEP